MYIELKKYLLKNMTNGFVLPYLFLYLQSFRIHQKIKLVIFLRSLHLSIKQRRTKRRRTEEIRSKFTLETLSYATQISLRVSENSDASNVVKDVTSASPSRATKYRKAMHSTFETIFIGEAALSLLVEQKLSESVYKIKNSKQKKITAICIHIGKISITSKT